MGLIVYILCGLTSGYCTWLLLANYYRTRVPMLMWSGLCFAGLCLNNLILMVDLIYFPGEDHFGVPRNLLGAVATSFLLYGLLWDRRTAEVAFPKGEAI